MDKDSLRETTEKISVELSEFISEKSGGFPDNYSRASVAEVSREEWFRQKDREVRDSSDHMNEVVQEFDEKFLNEIIVLAEEYEQRGYDVNKIEDYLQSRSIFPVLVRINDELQRLADELD
ncbi:hypothetical protein [Natronoglomus mannanivorans]|uniref:Uncharacterized protein n=1 Tax=Natronoglomus mannanivorans TaxID=2979990 RepID=A0AAP2Z2L8_9EURY|nr:hypothetical protein [Halobacteria archaeon AArc-xg1-1]